MTAIVQDTLKTRRTLTVGGKRYDYFSLPEAAKSLGDISRLPVSLKVLLENVLLITVSRPWLSMAPPPVAELPEKVQLVTVSAPN